jgi:hypothetical protein
MEYKKRRRRKNNILITGWRGEGNSKHQITEDIKFYKRKERKLKVKIVIT